MGIKHFMNTLIHKDYDIIMEEYNKFCDENLDAVLHYINKKESLSLVSIDDVINIDSFSIKKYIVNQKKNVLELYEKHLKEVEAEKKYKKFLEKENEVFAKFEKTFIVDNNIHPFHRFEWLNLFMQQNRDLFYETYQLESWERKNQLQFLANNWRHQEFILNHIEEYFKFAEQCKLLEDRIRQIKEKENEAIEKLDERFRIEALPLILEQAKTISENRMYGIPFKFFHDYYPVSEGEDVGNEAWEARKLIWNFKGKKKEQEARTAPIVFKSLQYSFARSSLSHNAAVGYVARMVRNSLRASFGPNMKHLTFVCITASTKESNQDRYEMFSKIVCGSDIIKDERLINAYEHIQVLQDAVPKHLGGTGLPSLHFDEDFFRGKYVVLFDDVVTSGGSMMRYVDKLRSMGAVVVALYAIGKTTYK